MRLTVALVGTTLSLVGATTAIHAAKPPASVSCSVQMRDDPGDIVRSDGGGTYTNGAGGVSCSIDDTSKWLTLTFSSPGKHQPARSLVVVGHGDVNGVAPYSTVSSSTELDIMQFGAAVSPTDVSHWRLRMSNAPQFIGSFGQLTGDSTYDAVNPGHVVSLYHDRRRVHLGSDVLRELPATDHRRRTRRERRHANRSASGDPDRERNPWRQWCHGARDITSRRLPPRSAPSRPGARNSAAPRIWRQRSATVSNCEERCQQTTRHAHRRVARRLTGQPSSTTGPHTDAAVVSHRLLRRREIRWFPGE